MTTSAEVRELLDQAEAFVRHGDPYAAASWGEAAVRRAFLAGPEALAEAELALERFYAAREARHREVERRNALHVANEHRVAGIGHEEPSERERRRSLSVALREWGQRVRAGWFGLRPRIS